MALDSQADQGEIYEEYMKLLAGGRVSSRRSQTQSVMERKRQEQLDQMKQTQRRKKEAIKKPKHRRHSTAKEPSSGNEESGVPFGQSFASLGRKKSSNKQQQEGGGQCSETDPLA